MPEGVKAEGIRVKRVKLRTRSEGRCPEEGLVARSCAKVARGFYQYLKDCVDVSPFLPFQAHRPKTEAYIAMQQRNIPLVYRFLSYRIQHALGGAREPVSRVRAKPFYDDFVQWAHERGHSTSKTTLSKLPKIVEVLIATSIEPEASPNTATRPLKVGVAVAAAPPPSSAAAPALATTVVLTVLVEPLPAIDAS